MDEREPDDRESLPSEPPSGDATDDRDQPYQSFATEEVQKSGDDRNAKETS